MCYNSVHLKMCRMNRIPNIVLNEKQAHELLTRNKIITGGEATVCESDNPHTLYKLFAEHGKPKPMGNNKEKKISLLYQMQPDYSIRPISTISLNDMIIGYEMSSDYYLRSYKLYQLSNDELLYFLKETKKILEYFSSKGIIYGDIEPRNILFNRNTGEIKFCDMDNIQIGNYKMDILPGDLIEYDMMRDIDDGVHPFMHNIMTLKAHNLDLYCSSDREMRKIFKHPAKKILSSMKEPQKFNDEYLVKYLKKYK